MSAGGRTPLTGSVAALEKTVRPPILFIHGAFSHHRHFASWVDFFSRAGFACHAPSLPGHPPADASALASLTFSDYLAALAGHLATLPAPPIIIGHSMGGLLAQQLAATRPCRALVCVASAPPWMLTAPPRSLPFLLPHMPAILAGRPLRPPEPTLRYLAVHDLPEDEQRELLPTFAAESGRAFRAMILGLARLPRKRFSGPVLCISGTADRLISSRTSDALARHYGAQHEIFARGHWLIAPSMHQEVAGRVLSWLAATLPTAILMPTRLDEQCDGRE